MKELFEQIESLVPTLQGWTTVEKAHHLCALVVALKSKVSLEIGVYDGRSFFAMALAHKKLGHGTVIGVDPWSPAAACEGYSGENGKFWQATPLELYYNNVQDKIHKLGVQNVSIIMRQKSDDVDMSVIPTLDVFHCDGQHTEQAVRDVKRFAPKVRVGGVCIMDDTGWSNSGDMPVRRAVDQLKSMGFVSLYPLGDGEVFQRVK